MNLEQAKKIVLTYKTENNIPTVRQTLSSMAENQHKIPVEQYIALDIVIWGHSPLFPTARTY
jgi:hypothetical protein